MSAYQSVSCGLHSEYELLAMHRSRVKLTCVSDDGSAQMVVGRVKDVVTREQAEYLVLEAAGAETMAIRLDKIQQLEKA